MSPALIVVLIVVVLAVIVGGAIYAKKQEDQREARLQQFATEHQLTYDRTGDQSLRERWKGKPFGAGDSRRVSDVVHGSWQGYPAIAFDYKYDTHSQQSNGQGGTTRTTTTHRFQVSALQLPVALGRLGVGSESILGGVGRALGMQDIEMESADFNRTFRITAEQDKLAYDVLHPRMMQWLLSLPRTPEFRIDGRWILAYDRDRQEPADLLYRLTLLHDVLQQIPEFVWKDHGADAR